MRIVRRASLGVLLASLVVLPARAESLERQALEPDVKALDRGPVHEAFARPTELKPVLPQAIDKEPPAPVPEIPPEQKPEGNNVQWLPGYWAWDEERKDFDWVSGTYRDIPAGRRYVPGYWAHTAEGWRWVPGYFAPEQQSEVPQYVPEPPASLDNGPSVPPPNDGSLYMPGNWTYRDGEFFWQPGYWTEDSPGFVWIGPQYLWTPRGWIFCNGYWDYPFNRRGLLFAPVAFGGRWGPGWSFRPRFVVNNLLNGLFWRAGRPFYYYGSFFGPNFAQMGFRPWFASPVRSDPVLNAFRLANPAALAGLQRAYSSGSIAPRVTAINQLSNGVRLSNLTPSQLYRQTVNSLAYRQAALDRGRREVGTASNAAQRSASSAGRSTSTVPGPATSPSPAGRAPANVNRTPPNISRSANIQGSTPQSPRVATSSAQYPRTVNTQPRYTSRSPTARYSPSRAATSYRPSTYSYRPAATVYRTSPSYSRSSGQSSVVRSGVSHGYGGRGGRR